MLYNKKRVSGTFTCGHAGEVYVYNCNRVNAEKKGEYIFLNNVCKECQKKEFINDAAKENEIATEKSKEMGLPNIEGSEKQILWANKIRLDILENLNNFKKDVFENIFFDENNVLRVKKNLGSINIRILKAILLNISNEKPINLEEVEILLNKFEEILLNKQKASFWIDIRNYTIDSIAEDILNNI